MLGAVKAGAEWLIPTPVEMIPGKRGPELRANIVQAEVRELLARPRESPIARSRSMATAATAVYRLKEWVKSRPRLDIEESTTWFLLLFIYAYGLTNDDLGFDWWGFIPQITRPQVSIALVLLCLTASVAVLIEPVLPCKMSKWTRGVRQSTPGRLIRYLGIFFAFILGWTSGIGLHADKVPSFSWLIVPVVLVGFVIVVLMMIKLFLPVRQ